MLGDIKNYKLLVTLLVLAILISVIFHIFFKQETDEGFTELYFLNPSYLPNEVYLGGNYNYSFSIRNLHEKPSTYEYISKLEFFNLYDVTEGIYKCSAKNRKKIILKWMENNETNINNFLLNNDNYNSFSIFSESDDYGEINWNYYNLQYRFKNMLKEGTFTTIFHDDDYIKYGFTVYRDTLEVEFTYRDNGTLKSERKKISRLISDNEVLINVSNSINYYLNGELIFNKVLENLTNGNFDFRMDDTYVLIGQLVAYKDSPIVVTRSRFTKEYDVDNSLIIGRLNELRDKSEDSVYLIRNNVNFTGICQEDECNNLKTYLNDPKNAYLFKTELKNFDENVLLSLINTGNASFYPDQEYLQNTTTSGLFWPDHTIRMNFQIFVKPHTFLISFDSNFMILFHNSNIYFVVKDGNNVVIHRRASPVEVSINDILLESKDRNIIVRINGFPVFNIERFNYFKDISIYTKKTIVAFYNIFASNKDKSCKTLSTSLNCRRIYRVESERRVAQKERLQAVTEPIKVSSGLGFTPFLGVSDIFDYENFVNDSKKLVKPSILQLLDYDIEIDPSSIIEEIPSEKYVFDGKNALVKNQNNYSFSFDSYILEGIGLMEVSFHNNDGIKIATLILNSPVKESYLFTNLGGILLKDTAKINVGNQDWHKFDIIHEANKTAYYLNTKKIFEIEKIDMSNGFFSITTFNTYFEIRDISLFNRGIKRRIPYYINADPCRLRKIYEKQISKDSLYLDSSEDKTITQSFNIDKDFDYGLVSIFLENEKNNQTEIHFWVVRND